MDNENVIFTNNGILFSLKKKKEMSLVKTWVKNGGHYAT